MTICYDNVCVCVCVCACACVYMCVSQVERPMTVHCMTELFVIMYLCMLCTVTTS
jgi:hypothetical protein